MICIESRGEDGKYPVYVIVMNHKAKDGDVQEERKVIFTNVEVVKDKVSATYKPVLEDSGYCGFGCVFFPKKETARYGIIDVRPTDMRLAFPNSGYRWSPQPGDTGYDLMC